MSQWAFVIAAYAVTILVTGGLLLRTMITCRRAEERAEALTPPK